MSIVVEPEEYIGIHLFVQPGYGWGWLRRDDAAVQVDYEQIQAEGGFHIRGRYFFTFQGELQGLVGVVEQSDHLFHGSWIGCTERHRGRHNYKDHLCSGWNLHIGPLRPQMEQHWLPVGSPLYSGYGILAESKADIDAFQVRCKAATT